jgi:hypothetical protein
MSYFTKAEKRVLIVGIPIITIVLLAVGNTSAQKANKAGSIVPPPSVPCNGYCRNASTGDCQAWSEMLGPCPTNYTCSTSPCSGSPTPTPTTPPGQPTPTPTPTTGFQPSIEFGSIIGQPDLYGLEEIISIGAQWKPESDGKFGWTCDAHHMGGAPCIKIMTDHGQGPLIIYAIRGVCGTKILNSESLYRVWWSPDGTWDGIVQLTTGYIPAKLHEIPDSQPITPIVGPIKLSGGYIWVGGDAYYPPDETHPASHEMQVEITVKGPTPTQFAGWQPGQQMPRRRLQELMIESLKARQLLSAPTK